MKKKIRLKDISDETGFSIKTVSRALNNHPDINKNTREKILKVAERFAYQPNLIAKSLRENKSYAIGYIVPDITNQFFGEVALAIESVFKKRGYSLLTSFTNVDKDKEIEALRILLSRQVDGIIVATIGTTGNYLKEIIEDFKIPIVVIDNKVKGYKTNIILHDNIKGAYLLTKHLIEHGNKNIACISGPLVETSGKRRLEGYKKALAEFNIDYNEKLVQFSNWKIDGGYDSTLKLFKGTHKPTAIFVANSIMALGALKALRELELKVPKDVAIDSFDNLDFTSATNPPLTTLRSIEGEIGKVAAELLLKIIETQDIVNLEEIYIDTELFIRKSCGC